MTTGTKICKFLFVSLCPSGSIFVRFMVSRHYTILYVSRPCTYCIVSYYTQNSAPIRIKLNCNTSWSTIKNIHCSLLGYDTMLSGTWVPILRRYTLLLHSGQNSEIPLFLENFRTNLPGYNTVLQLKTAQHVLLYLFLIMKQQTAFAHVCVYTYTGPYVK